MPPVEEGPERDDGGSLGRAWVRARQGLTELSGQRLSVRLAFAAAVAMVVGALVPWYEYGPDNSVGIDVNAGQTIVLIAAVAVVLLVRVIRSGRGADSGGIAALGLLGVAIMLAELNQIRTSDFVTDAWGLWVSAAGAGFLLLAGVSILGGSGEDEPKTPEQYRL